ncbi:M20 family peptidase [Corallococcus exiguus]|uniref:M20 family peptidase n=1 Tax=Corallococcus TaxID=83461 RepID=UPI000EECAA77|nr:MULTISPECIES: M20 family peptidase [Corallococcus]NNB90116.1 M20 family peptidase [Corallococcus exiguus]NNB98440.1 M20 family peptidase [Corallococcus exiguus]NNC05546.1 M20 family peptidase [Corallococcus exiguus]NPC50793.1 M20 family peptidase [Corallococcus exiguus]RKH75204.1 M20 family peptidase [Corallococcus sp. AB032C]
MKRVLLVLLVLVLLLGGVLVVRTLGFGSRQVTAEPAEPFTVDAAAAASRLAEALRHRTIASSDGMSAEHAAFQALHDGFVARFPRVHAELAHEAVGTHAHLYTWKGSEPDLRPVLLMGHLDVVPAEAEATWSHPPFGGVVANGYVYGRGTLDDKGSVLAILEAVEGLLAEGYRPRRTVMLAFGADEEVGGHDGAARVAALLRERGVGLESVLDEGGPIGVGLVPGVAAPVALVGVAEKGSARVELVVRSAGGHASMPPPQTAANTLARALVRLEENPFKPELRGGTRALFEYVGPEMNFGMRLLFANTWLFAPVIERQMSAAPSTNASIRTTFAATMLEGSPKPNVLPSKARAVLNVRLLPGDSLEDVRTHMRKVVDDERVELTAEGDEASPVSRLDTEGWGQLQRSIRQVFPDVLVAPFLTVAATDARYFHPLSDSVYRFVPVRMNREDLTRMHGRDERLSVEEHAAAIRFYAQYLRNSTR